jgi:N utilization substance protein A
VSITIDTAHAELLDALTARVPEIAYGVIDIAAIATAPGIGTKVAVRAHVSGVDPVGACIGRAGFRIRDVERELGEHITIVAHHHQPLHFIENAVGVPVVAADITDPARHRVTLTVAPCFYSRAMGRAGSNLRLARALTGWDIRLQPASGREALHHNDNRRKKPA